METEICIYFYNWLCRVLRWKASQTGHFLSACQRHNSSHWVVRQILAGIPEHHRTDDNEVMNKSIWWLKFINRLLMY